MQYVHIFYPKYSGHAWKSLVQVIKIGACHRVDGNLNLSRAFGDFSLKAAALPPEKQKASLGSS